MRIILIAGPIMEAKVDLNSCYSVESGYHDGQQHFDHHGIWEHQLAPCNRYMPAIPDNSTVYITHMDADTYIGLRRLMGKEIPPLDLNLMEKVDLNGTSVVADKMFNTTVAYMVGVGEVSKALGMPHASATAHQDVTHIVEAMNGYGWATIAEMGGEAMIRSESVYQGCGIEDDEVFGTGLKVGLWSINKDQPLDPSRAYEDGYAVVVVYRSHHNSVSLYGNAALLPDGTDLRQVWDKCVFEGHALACGAARHLVFSELEAYEIMDWMCTRPDMFGFKDVRFCSS